MQEILEDLCSKSDFRNYPKEFKEMVVRAVVKEGVRQASRILKISQTTVQKREFSKKGSE